MVSLEILKPRTNDERTNEEDEQRRNFWQRLRKVSPLVDPEKGKQEEIKVYHRKILGRHKKRSKRQSNDPRKVDKGFIAKKIKIGHIPRKKIDWPLLRVTKMRRKVFNQTLTESRSSARDKVFSVAIFFGTSALKLWNPLGGVSSQGIAKAENAVSYTVFRVAMVVLLLVAFVVAIELVRKNPKSRKESKQQLKQVQFIIWLGSFVFLTGFVAGYCVVSSNPFRGVLEWFVHGFIGLSVIAVIVAGLKK